MVDPTDYYPEINKSKTWTKGRPIMKVQEKTMTPEQFAELLTTGKLLVCDRVDDDDATPTKARKATTPRIKAKLTDYTDRLRFESFAELKRAYETALADGDGDLTGTLALDIGTVIAFSVIKKCIDPTGKRADATRTANSGCNPYLLKLQADIGRDIAILRNTRTESSLATNWTLTADGTFQRVPDDHADALTDLANQTLGDGIDLAQSGATEIWAQGVDHATAPGWLDAPYDIGDDKTSTPMQAAYRAVRDHVDGKRAVSIDPTGKVLWYDAYDPETLDVVYRRLRKGWDTASASTDCTGCITVDAQLVTDIDDLVGALGLTPRQATIIGMRLANKGIKDVGKSLGISHQGVAKHLVIIGRKVVKHALATGNNRLLYALAHVDEIDGYNEIMDAYNQTR